MKKWKDSKQEENGALWKLQLYYNDFGLESLCFSTTYKNRTDLKWYKS